MPSAQEKSLLFLSLKRFLNSGPAGNEWPFPPLLRWITKADEQYSGKNADSRERTVFLQNTFILLKPSSEARRAGTPCCLTSWLAPFQPGSPPAGQRARQPQLAKNHFCKKQLKQIVLVCLQFHHVNKLFQHGMKWNVNTPESSTKEK